MPTALVTGAHGFLGRHFAARLAREGWQVIGLGHGDWSPAQARGEPIELFGDGNETRDMLHVEDAVAIGLRAAKALESDSLLVINGGTGIASTVRETAGRLAALYGAPEPRFNRRIREGDPRHYRAGMDGCAALGFSPRWRLPAGLEDFVAWKRSCA